MPPAQLLQECCRRRGLRGKQGPCGPKIFASERCRPPQCSTWNRPALFRSPVTERIRNRVTLACRTRRAQLMSQLSSTPTSAPSAAELTGRVRVLIQFDVCEEIRLDLLQQIINSRTVQQPNFKHAAPAYVRYQRPPVVVAADPLILDSGEQLTGEIKYYDYGVVSIQYQLPFSGDWNSLVRLASRWVWDIDFASRAEPMIRQRLARS